MTSDAGARDGHGRRPNRLATQTSPYLLQHAYNPVDWYPWGSEALGAAKERDTPILLSIGYAACHWCHVMERESFEDDETAAVMNELFVNIKVDREERPDLDSVYMSAVSAMTGHGGWPMTVFLTPDGKPFYGGTYFPPEDRHGLPAFRRVLRAVSEAWTARRDEIERQGAELVDHIERTARPEESPGGPSVETLRTAAVAMAGAVDRGWGGFGGAPKFPSPMNLEFLLRMHVGGTVDVLDAVDVTLDRMARGGIFDQVGGGFHRYSVDARWLVPHFEKMLYDNAQLLRLYARAWQVTGSDRYRDTALATADYLLREMQHPGGGFFASQDADSEGVEGRFYVWSADAFSSATGDDAALAGAALGISEHGNWEGTNVLWLPRLEEEVAADHGATAGDVRAAVARARTALRDARLHRVAPATDDKVLASWNGLAIAGLAEAGRAFGRADLVQAASRAAAFILAELRSPQGRLLRSWRDGRTSGPGFLDDHAMLADGLVTLYETTFDVRWWNEARSLAHAIVELFGDREGGGFYDVGSDVDAPVVRPKDLFDNALPSGGSAAASALLRIAALAGSEDLERAAGSFLRVAHRGMETSPLGFGHALSAADLAISRAIEIAIVGDLDAPDARALIAGATGRYIPNRVMAAGAPGSTEPALLRDRAVRDGSATAYVCRDFACRVPVTDPAELAAQLGV